MSEPFDDQLKKALRPIDPGEDFTSMVMKRVDEERHTPKPARVEESQRSAPHSAPRRPLWLTAGLAASLVLVVGIVEVHEHREREEGLRARQQLLDALSVTSEKLNIAYRVVHDQAEISIEAETPSEQPVGDADNGA